MEAVATPVTEEAPQTQPTIPLSAEAAELYDKMDLIPFFSPSLLKKPADFVFDENIEYAQRLADALHKKMVDLGVFGLSANQVGLDHRVFVVGTPEKRILMFNPRILGYTRETTPLEEACVSLPNFSLVLSRPEGIHVSYQDETGGFHTGYYTGVSARIIQHEYDHMEGMNFTHHASNFKLKRELKKYQKRQQKLLQRKG